MPNLPIPIRAALGLAATAVEEARKLPETLPQAVTTVPVIAVGAAMQASMRVQQRIAALAAKGDQVISEFRGTPSEPPAWATFDDEADDNNGSNAADQGGDGSAEHPQAAFDRIDYDATGFVESDDDEQGRWDAVGAGTGVTGMALGIAEALVEVEVPAPEELGDALAENAELIDLPDDLGSITEDDSTRSAPAEDSAAETDTTPRADTTAPTKTAAAKRGAAKRVPTKSDPSSATPTELAPGTAAAAKKAPPATKAPATKAPAKKAPAATPAKKAPAKKRAPRASEPLEVAAKKAQRAKRPTPSTMAAEIVQAHEADSDNE